MKKCVVFLMVLLFSVQVAAFADGGKGSCHAGKKKMMEYFMKLQEALKLSDQQIGDIQSKCFAHKKEMVKERASLELALIELKELKAQDTADLKKIEGKIREIANLKANMEIKKLKNVEDTKNVLNDSQKETLKKLKKRPYLLKSLAEEGQYEESVSGNPDEIESEYVEEIAFFEEVFGFDLMQE